MLMDKFRNSASLGFVWKIIMGVIGVSFVLSGVAGYMFTQTDTSAAKVNGVEISQQTFLQLYNNEYEALSQQLGPQFSAVADSPEFINGLRERILNRLVDQELLRQYSEDLKLNISDEQVKEEIVRSPNFQTDGKFDNARYQQMLTLNRISSDMYAEYVRDALRLEQLQTALLHSDFIVPAQSEELAKYFYQRRDVRTATLPLEGEIAKQVISEQEAQGYYEENKASFAMPELIKVQYLDLTKAIAEKNVQVTDVEIAQYYQDNKSQYMTQRLAHIQLPTEQEAQSVYASLQKGENFAELAKLYSADKMTALQGGDLDWVVAGMMPPAFEKAASSLAVGEYSQPVKVDNAYHIIKVEEERVRPLQDVKEEIAFKLRLELATSAFYALEKQANEKAFENPESLAKVAEILGIPLQETDYFSRNDVPATLNHANVLSVIFNPEMSQNAVNSEAINVGEQHSVIVRVIDHKAEGIKAFNDVKADIENYLKRQKAETLVLEQAKQLTQALANGEKPTTLSFGDKTSWIYADNKDPVLNNAVFSMPKPSDKPTYVATKSGNGNIVIIELLAVEEGKLTPQELAQFNAEVMKLRQTELSHTILKALRSKAKIEVNQDFVYQEQ